MRFEKSFLSSLAAFVTAGTMLVSGAAIAAGPTNPVGTTNTLSHSQPQLGQSGVVPHSNAPGDTASRTPNQQSNERTDRPNAETALSNEQRPTRVTHDGARAGTAIKNG